MSYPLIASDTLQFTQGDQRWEDYRRRAKNDLFWLASVVLGYSNHFPYEAETHLLPTRFLERKTGVAELDSAPIQLVLWPRFTGKSSIGTVAQAIQFALQEPETAILIAAIKAELAQDFLKTIQWHFQSNELLRALFPELIPPNFRETEWNQQRATLNRKSSRPEPTFDTIGAGGSKVGKHYDIIIVDDLINEDVAKSIRSGSYIVLQDTNFWVTTLRPMLTHRDDAAILFRGTRWWVGDTYDFIEQTFGHGEEKKRFRLKAVMPGGKAIRREAYRIGDISVMRIAGMEEGIPQFPKIWSPSKMETYRMENAELFASFVQNDPTEASVRTFQDSWLHYWQALDPRLIRYVMDDGASRAVFREDLHKQIVVDPAFTSTGQGARSAIVTMGTDRETGKHLVLDVFADRIEPRDLVSEILHRVKQFKISRVYIEAVAQQAGFIQFVQSQAIRENLPIMLETVKPGGRNKDVRIEGMAAYFKGGQVFVHASQNALLEEYRQYKPGAITKDVLDALAYSLEVASVYIPSGSRGGVPRSGWERAQAEVGTYLKRRGLR